MFVYHGRTLNVDNDIINEYRQWLGQIPPEWKADLHIHNKFIKTHSDPMSLLETLTDEELTAILSEGFRRDIDVYKS